MAITGLLPIMAERGSGALLVTSATAAMRGNAGQGAHAAAMGGRRMLCQVSAPLPLTTQAFLSLAT